MQHKIFTFTDNSRMFANIIEVIFSDTKNEIVTPFCKLSINIAQV